LIGLSLLVAAFACCAMAVRRSRALNMDADTRSALAALIGATVFHLVVASKQGSMLLNPLLFLHLILVPKLVLASSAAAPMEHIVDSPQPHTPFPNLMRA
jgi:hypothetical protein